jgi:hypothetical protein
VEGVEELRVKGGTSCKEQKMTDVKPKGKTSNLRGLACGSGIKHICELASRRHPPLAGGRSSLGQVWLHFP